MKTTLEQHGLRELSEPGFGQQVEQRFAALLALSDGWFDGVGKAPESRAVGVVMRLMAKHFPKGLPLPQVAPTPEGNLLLEWSGAGTASVDVDLATMRGAYHAFDGEGGDVEREFDLGNDEGWAELMGFLRETLMGGGQDE